ncbi:MAG: LysR family transcriptional regulator [Pseudomonadota bacterium]
MDQMLAMRVFARVVEANSFTGAADSLQMPKPSVTKLVQQLESHLRVKLLQRTTRRLTVTAEGAAYYERTARVLAEIEDIEAEVTQARISPTGRLRVDVGSSIANLILIPALPDFHARYPDIRIELGVSDRSVDLIGEGVDCVIRGTALDDSTLVARRIAELPFVTCATPGYVERHGIPTSPAQLREGHEAVGYVSPRTGRTLPLRYGIGDTLENIDLPCIVSVNESTAHLSATLTGIGLAQTFRFMAQPHFHSGLLVPVLAEWPQGEQSIWLVYPPERHLRTRLRAFVDWTVALFAPYGAPFP